MMNDRSVTDAGATNLLRLAALRAIIAVGQLFAVVIAAGPLAMPLPLTPLLSVIAVAAVITILTWFRAQHAQSVSDREFFLHLLVDVTVLTVLLYFVGGATNPFVVLYLLPLMLCAAALPPRYTWTMVAITTIVYSALMNWYRPIAHGHEQDFGLHVVGMWLGFVVSASLIGYFAVRMADTRRERDRIAAHMREQALRNERLIALGTFAAGAAHELGTPLSTMAVIVQELQEQSADPERRERLKLLRAQIRRCKEILGRIAASAGQAQADTGCGLALDAYLDELLARWRETRPAVSLQSQWRAEAPVPRILADQTLSQAIVNVLDNAADASPHQVEVDSTWRDGELVLEVRDRGPGLSADVESRAGQEIYTTKAGEGGLGLGLFLARATIERLGGKIFLSNRAEGGACARLTLPLEKLTVAA